MADFKICPISKRLNIEMGESYTANISDAVLRSGLTMVANHIESTYRILGNVIETAIGDNKRIIIFYDDPVIQGLTSKYEFAVASAYGAIANLKGGDSEGSHLAQYAMANPRQHIMINVHGMLQNEAASLMRYFAETYARMQKRPKKPTLLVTIGLNITMPRARTMKGDTRSVASYVWQQMKAARLNLEYVNVVTSLSEAPLEFGQSASNLLLFRIEVPDHIRKLRSHLTTPQSMAILVNMDKQWGIRKMEDGYGILYNPSDRFSSVTPMPFIVEEKELSSKIGTDPEIGEKSREKSKKLGDFLADKRKEEKERKRREAADRLKEEELEKAMKMEIRRQARLEAKAKLLGTAMKTTVIANNNEIKGSQVTKTHFWIAGGNDFRRKTIDGKGYYELRQPAAKMITAYRSQVKGASARVNGIEALEAYRKIEIEPLRKVAAIARKTKLGGAMIITAAVLSRRQEEFMNYLLSEESNDVVESLGKLYHTETLWRRKIKMLVNGFRRQLAENKPKTDNVIAVGFAPEKAHNIRKAA